MLSITCILFRFVSRPLSALHTLSVSTANVSSVTPINMCIGTGVTMNECSCAGYPLLYYVMCLAVVCMSLCVFHLMQMTSF